MKVTGPFTAGCVRWLVFGALLAYSPSVIPTDYHSLWKNTVDNVIFLRQTEVLGKIGSADKTLTTFEAAVTNIEKNRAKFPHVDDQELASRKESVLQLKERLAAARNTVTGKKVQGKMDQDRKSVRFPCLLCSCFTPPT
jgi:hypothetical protein